MSRSAVEAKPAMQRVVTLLLTWFLLALLLPFALVMAGWIDVPVAPVWSTMASTAFAVYFNEWLEVPAKRCWRFHLFAMAALAFGYLLSSLITVSMTQTHTLEQWNGQSYGFRAMSVCLGGSIVGYVVWLARDRSKRAAESGADDTSRSADPQEST